MKTTHKKRLKKITARHDNSFAIKRRSLYKTYFATRKIVWDTNAELVKWRRCQQTAEANIKRAKNELEQAEIYLDLITEKYNSRKKVLDEAFVELNNIEKKLEKNTSPKQ